MTKQLLIAIGILAVLLLLGASVYLSPRKISEVSVATPSAATSSIAVDATSSVQPSASNKNTGYAGAQNTNKPPIVRIIGEATYEHDYSIDKYLMGESHNVFVAKIIKQVATTTRAGTPATQYEAEVVYNIKGYAQGTITVEQEGGYLKGILYVPYGELLAPANTKNAGHLLEPGFTYLLATRHSQANDPYTVGSLPYFAKLISQDSTLSNAQLQTLATNDSRVKQLQAAYPNEVLASSDVYNHTAWNNYQSLTEAQKYALPYYTGSYNPNPPAPTSTATSTGQ